MKLYFDIHNEERCYPKDHFIQEMKDNFITEMQVHPAKMVTGEDFAFCTEFDDCVEVRTGDCGKFCESYSPRNGKNGRCKFSHNCYEPTDEIITFKIKP